MSYRRRAPKLSAAQRRRIEHLRPAPGWVTTAELVDMLGITYRQAIHWSANGWITPKVPPDGSGSRTFFDPEAVFDALDFASLVHAGIPPSTVAEWTHDTRAAVLTALQRGRAA